MARKQTFNNKNQLNKILQDVDTIQGEAIIDQKNKTISAKFNGTIKGGYMANDGFTQKQLEQLGLVMDAKIQPINERLTSIENRLENVENRLDVLEQDVSQIKDRLDVVEKDIKTIKNCPTIQKEIKED